MIINFKLDTASLESAIRKIEMARDELIQSTEDFVDILCVDGAEVANSRYGRMATAWAHRDSDENDPDDGIIVGHIGVTARNEDVAVIAEFGAGNATIPVQFENEPDVEVYPGAYSELVGTGEYADTGRWHFGGVEYRAVIPRAGLLNARNHIMDHGDSVAEEVIHL